VLDHPTLPLPEPGAPPVSTHGQARAARRRLHGHQLLWLGLAALIVATSVADDLPPALNPVVAVLGVALAIRGVRRAWAQRDELLRARGSEPTHDVIAALRRRADPRGELARSFGRAATWWTVLALASTGYLIACALL
jgi:hypothetical protein